MLIWKRIQIPRPQFSLVWSYAVFGIINWQYAGLFQRPSRDDQTSQDAVLDLHLLSNLLVSLWLDCPLRQERQTSTMGNRACQLVSHYCDCCWGRGDQGLCRTCSANISSVIFSGGKSWYVIYFITNRRQVSAEKGERTSKLCHTFILFAQKSNFCISKTNEAIFINDKVSLLYTAGL